MKKLLFFALICTAVAVILSGCGAPKPRAVNVMPRTKTENTETPSKRTVEIEIDKNNDKDVRLGEVLPIVGVRRRIHNPAGEYTVEYVHYPREAQKDETLNYSLTLNSDNTYSLTVVTDGVQANHFGNWYLRSGGSLVLYYDEPIDKTAHNVFVSDCMYGEMLPHGKIMIYDNCNVIVLSKTDLNSANRAVTLPNFVTYGIN